MGYDRYDVQALGSKGSKSQVEGAANSAWVQGGHYPFAQQMALHY